MLHAVSFSLTILHHFPRYPKTPPAGNELLCRRPRQRPSVGRVLAARGLGGKGLRGGGAEAVGPVVQVHVDLALEGQGVQT